MIATLSLGLALAAAQVSEPHVIDDWEVATTARLRGADFLLISEAFKHPEIRARDMSCYHVVVTRERGTTTVAFLGDREPDREVSEGDHIAIIIPGPNARCPDRSFVMDDRGRVVRVVYSRH